MAENLQVTPELKPESKEYIDAMASKGEAAVNGGVQPEVIAPKPEGIPDKFYNAETGVVDYASLAKSYVELEKSKGSPQEKPADKPAATKPEVTTPDSATEAVEAAGLDMSVLSKEYAEDGALTQESYDKLAKAGIPKDMVDSYIDGQLAKAEVARTQAHSITDGETGYKAMIEYARANLSQEEIVAYNQAVNSSNPSVRDLAIRGMWAKYGAESGTQTDNLVTNKTNSKVGDGSYQSRAEMMADMGKPQYKNDPAFRAKVSAKLANSNIF